SRRGRTVPRVGRLRDGRDTARRRRRPCRPLVNRGDDMTTLQTLIGIELPIIQAPMAGVQGSALTTAVSNAGAVGSLPCALLDPATMRKELAAIRSQTHKPYNFNFFCHAQPTANDDREKGWRERLAPFYAELGLDEVVVPQGNRAPFSAEAADILEEFR